MRNFFFTFLMLFVFVGLSGCTTANNTASQNVSKKISALSPTEFSQRISQAEGTIIDVRTKQEFTSGYIPGAVNIDFYSPTFASTIGQLDRSKTYYLYCQTGSRSQAVLSVMEDLGFTQVSELEGGIINWNGTLEK